MAQSNDDLYLGSAPTQVQGVDTGLNNPTAGANTTSPPNGGMGVGPMGRVYVYDVVPQTVDADALYASARPAALGNVAISAAGASITASTNAAGEVIYVLDCPRNITITSAGNDSGMTFLVTGANYLGQPLTQLITGGNATGVASLKAFKSITTIYASVRPASTIEIGVGDVFGLPYRVLTINHIVAVKWAATLAADAATVVVGVATSPATNLTGDTRGTVAPSSASNGTRRLTVSMFLPGIASGPNATRVGALGVTDV